MLLKEIRNRQKELVTSHIHSLLDLVSQTEHRLDVSQVPTEREKYKLEVEQLKQRIDKYKAELRDIEAEIENANNEMEAARQTRSKGFRIHIDESLPAGEMDNIFRDEILDV